jgi:hypothetical protein
VAHYPFFAALIFAQRVRCAAAIFFVPACDIFRVGRAVLFRADRFPVVRLISNSRGQRRRRGAVNGAADRLPFSC